ncbi:2-oxoacid:acceptor oxidoreductase family protein, partial [Candidatus Dojkabacteria bacterium]|nr:2-oxoacid:acceptor oxidoreductase family protein [Candidatus Dojkabacteria bacterium]
MATALRRVAIKFAGESGQGVNSIGEIIAKACKRSGFKVFAYREYPSLIQGGNAAYQIDVSDNQVNSSTSKVDLLVCISRHSIHAYLETLMDGGLLVHSISKVAFTNQEQKWISDHKINVLNVDTFATAKSLGGNYFTSSMVMTGYVGALLGIGDGKLTDIISAEFADKPELLDIDLKCLQGGYKLLGEKLASLNLPTVFKTDPEWESSLVLSGNQAIGTGAIAAGVRVVYGYPMTPASSILSFLADQSQRTGMVVKQAEDEITAAQMTLGSMFMGTRAMTTTSGGGFDLMTESISLAGMTETPFVCVLAQRPGPATGVPTWTAAGDLNLAIYAGHGEFPRIVLAASDAASAYRLTQEAFNLAENYQTVVVLLTEKQIA